MVRLTEDMIVARWVKDGGYPVETLAPVGTGVTRVQDPSERHEPCEEAELLGGRTLGYFRHQETDQCGSSLPQVLSPFHHA